MQHQAHHDVHAEELRRILDTMRSFDHAVDSALIERAYVLARDAHAGQNRMTGEPYIVHPLAVALYLAERKFDSATIAASLLHDVLEDTSLTETTLRAEVGDEVTNLVVGVTVLDKIKYRGVERYIENLRKMFVAMAKDLRVIIIKLADRIDNLRTLHVWPKEKRVRIARDSMEILVPIAYRLCLNEMRGDLEDLAFMHLDPKEYTWTKNILHAIYPARDAYLKEIQDIVSKRLAQSNIPVIGIYGRTKRVFSLYQKLLKHDRDINQLYDLVALRIVVKTVPECYATLGIMHQLWKPLKGRVKDYIANPKPNGYQSLHTSVFCERGEVVEFQIRTEAMHEMAEFGFAGHWRVGLKVEKDASPKDAQRVEQDWIKELTTWSRSLKDKTEELERRKLDVFQKRIFVYTPEGEVFDLPEGSTPVDFAYYVHSDLGRQCTMALINEEKRALDAELKTGDVVRILTEKRKKSPSAEWLDFVKTSRAKQHIREQLRGNILSLLKR